MHEINLNYVYHAGKTLCLGYKNKPVNAVHFVTFLKSMLNYCVCLCECVCVTSRKSNKGVTAVGRINSVLMWKFGGNWI